jgi:multidrug efflux pump subunit AcrA (membrane-fusion protein)
MAKQKHSDEIQQIISAPPKWLVRWGVLLMLVCLILFIYLARAIHYPQIVRGRVTLTQSVVISAFASGELINVIKLNDQVVNVGDTLGYIVSGRGKPKLLPAPVGGLLYKLRTIGELSNVEKGDLLFAIRNDSISYTAQLSIPAVKAGKIRVGQEVIVKLDQNAQNKSLTLYGVIATLSRSADINGNLYGQIKFNKKRPPGANVRPGLSGDANIVCEQTTLADRLLSHVKITLLRR